MKRFRHYGMQYFALGSNKPVGFHFENFEHLIVWFKSLEKRYSETEGYTPRVFLLTYDEIVEGSSDVEVFVTENLNHLIEIIEQDALDYDSCRVWHFQEYESFQEAYEVALLIREENKLCYSKN